MLCAAVPVIVVPQHSIPRHVQRRVIINIYKALLHESVINALQSAGIEVVSSRDDEIRPSFKRKREREIEDKRRINKLT